MRAHRINLLQAAASMAREIPDPTANDDHLRTRLLHIYDDMKATD